MDGDDEQITSPATKSDNSAERRSRGRGRRRSNAGAERERQSLRTKKWVTKYQSDDKWSLTEKQRLLEALRRYGAHNLSSIAKLVGTRNEEEVETKIRAIKGIDATLGRSDRAEVVPGQEVAPIETWIDLVQEMTCYEPADYSQFIPKVLGTIARNEYFEDSDLPRLRWSNIYQFLSAVTEERADVQQLSDMESLVILDLMHNLGDTLYKSDISEQCRILDFKYNLLNFKCDNPNKAEREIINQRIIQALHNDFWDLEDLPGKDTSDTSSVSSATSSLSSSATANLHERGTSSSSLSPSLSTAGPSSQMDSNTTTMNSERITDQTMASTSGPVPGPSHATNSVNPSAFEPSGQENPALSSTELHSRSSSISERDTDSNFEPDVDDDDSNSQIGADSERRFRRPLYFTLNPLCVPTQLLGFKPKSQNSNT